MCKREYKIVTRSHVKNKHGLTWDEYESYGAITLYEDNGEPVKSVWDSVNIDAIEFKIQTRLLKQNIVRITDRYSVDLRQGKNCFGCLESIDEIFVYIILSSDAEIRTKTPYSRKKPYHRRCATVKASRSNLIGIVSNPLE